nr:hypothetical protein [uncultured Carboxylicivirga sp.]
MKEKQSNMQDAIYKNLQENKNYAYEIRVESNSGHILIVPRTNNIEAFTDNIESAKDIARQEGKNIKVCIYRGMSPKAGKVEEYPITLGENKTNSASNQSQIEQAIESALQKHKMAGNNSFMGNLDGISQLFGALTGIETDKENTSNTFNGLAGLLGAVSNARHENTMMIFEKKFNDYKQETEIGSLKKQLQEITSERDALKQQNQRLDTENNNYKTEVSDLETRLAGYSNTEIIKRVATGVLSGIGSKLLAGSPKAAELLGLTKHELQSALGFIEEEASNSQSHTPEANVQVEELHPPQTEQQKQLFKAIDDTANALKQGDINFAYYMITIIGNCMDSQELTESIVHHLEEEKQRMNMENEMQNTSEEEQ